MMLTSMEGWGGVMPAVLFMLVVALLLIIRLSARLTQLSTHYQALNTAVDKLERGLREEIARNRIEGATLQHQSRDEARLALERLNQALGDRSH